MVPVQAGFHRARDFPTRGLLAVVFERAVLDHLGPQAAFPGPVDLFEENAIQKRADLRTFLVRVDRQASDLGMVGLRCCRNGDRQ
jgi:hypothetical protein